MTNPVPAITYSVTFAVYTAIITGGAATVTALGDCNGMGDLLAGDCNDFIDAVLDAVAFGAITGAAPEVNLVFILLGLVCRATIIVWLWSKGLWAGIIALVPEVGAALVAWLI